MKIFKILGVLLLLVVLALGGAAFYLSQNINRLITDTVETSASATTGTPVTLGAVNVALQKGRVELGDLVVANPSGFNTSHAFRLDNFSIQLDLGTLMDEVIYLDELTIDGANVIAEQQGMSKETNLHVIQGNVNKHAAQSGGASTEGEAKPEIKLVVRSLNIVNTQGSLVSEKAGELTLAIEDYNGTNVGEAQGGMTPDQLSEHIINQITSRSRDAAAAELQERIKKKFGEKIKDKFNSLFDR
jgi:hypothetical protein